MSRSRVIQKYWRSLVIGTLGGALAYTGSFAVNDSYVSGTRLLIRGREASFLTDTAQNVSNQPGIVDSSFAKTLGATQAGIVTSQQMAATIVDELKLDRKPARKDGTLTRVLRRAMLVYAKSKAYLTHGFYRQPTRREQAISDVQLGLTAQTLDNSYILEIVATAETPGGARDIANSAAKQLISVSATRAKSDANRYADALLVELRQAEADFAKAAAEVGDLKTARGVANIDAELTIDATTRAQLRTDAAQNDIALAGTKAELESLNRSLKQIDPNQSGEQTIKTGRSETKIVTNQPSSVYQQLIQQRDTIQARLAQLQAEHNALAQQLGSPRQTQLNTDQADLLPSQEQLRVAQQRRVELSARYAEAKANAVQPSVELSRIDSASVPDYPVGPKRYLYLALGLMLGVLAGWGLTLLSTPRRNVRNVTQATPTKTTTRTTTRTTIDEFDPEYGSEEDDDSYIDIRRETVSAHANGTRQVIEKEPSS
jgi:uncharacterized protein involved in exopolysaccharide biosynthesis